MRDLRRNNTVRPQLPGGPAGGRRPQRRWWLPSPRARRVTAVLLVICALTSTAAWAWWQGHLTAVALRAGEQMVAFSASMGLVVREVYLAGRRNAPRQQIRAVLGIDDGQAMLAFDPHAAKRRLEEISWIRTAIVERKLPDTLYIRIVERQPFALWQNKGSFHLIDRDGVVIASTDFDRFKHLPLLVGSDAPRQASELIDLLVAEPTLARRVQALVRVGGRRWDVRLLGGLIVKLPEEDPAGAWARLAALDLEHGILSRDILVVDLRIADRLIVRLPEGMTPKSRPSSDATERGHDT